MAEIFDVFISYRRSDGQALARELYSYLNEKGVRVFLDEVKLLDGDFFDTQLRDKLICAPHYVLIGTTEAFTVREGEDWVKNEMELAVDEQEKAAQGERTITVLQPHDAKIPDVLPGKLGRAVKVQRIIMQFGVDNDEYFGKVFDVVTKVSKRNLWHSAHRWLEKSKRQGGRFARLHIDESIMPRAGDFVRRGEMSVNVNIDKQDGDEAPLLTAIRATDEHLFLIGQGGIGKTTSLMKIMDKEYVDRAFSCGRQIPIFVELSYAPDNDGRYYEQGKSSFIRRSIFKQIRERDFDSQAVLNGVEAKDNAFTVSSETAVLPINELFTKRTERPEFLLLLDGLNEVSLAKVKNTENSVIDLIRGEIRYLINECPNVRVILTSRSDDACRYFSELKRLYLTGVDEKSIKKYLEDCKMSQAQIDAALSDEHLKDTLKIPLFLTMYSTLKNKEGVCTQGEILRCFFHERRENIGFYTVQDRIARVGENAAASEAVMDKTRLTVEMQNFIIDLILPEIGRYMENNGEFHISRKVLREIISKVLDGRDDTDFCGICGDDAFRIGNRQGATREPSMIADEIKDKFADNKNRITASIIECLIYSLGIMQMNTDESGYGFMHQHIRGFFAAISYINAMRLAVYLYKDGDKDEALSVMNERFKDNPVGMQVRRFIGEALGEHHNAPYYDNGWKQNAPENDPLRGLITRTLNIYRGVSREDGGFGVWSLVHILNEVRGELSGMDFSGIDFTRCSMNGMRLSRKGVEARFENACISFMNLGFQGHNRNVVAATYSQDGKRIITKSIDGIIKTWDQQSFDLVDTYNTASEAAASNVCNLNGEMTSICSNTCPDGSKTVVINDGKGLILNSKDLSLLGELKGGFNSLKSVFYSPDGKQIVALSGSEKAGEYRDALVVWCADTFEIQGVLNGIPNEISSISFSPDSRQMLTVYEDGTVLRWDVKNLIHIDTLKMPLSHIWSGMGYISLPGDDRLVTRYSQSCSYSPDGKRIVFSAFDGTAQIWDTERLILLDTISKRGVLIKSALFSPNGAFIVSWSLYGQVQIWESESLALLKEIDTRLFGHCDHDYDDEVSHVAFSHDSNRLIVSFYNGFSKVFDMLSLKLSFLLQTPTWQLFSASFSPDRKRIVTAAWDQVTIWDADRFKKLGDIDVYDGDVCLCASFSPSGNRIIAAAGDSGKALISDAKTLLPIGELADPKHHQPMIFAEYSPDEQRIITLRQLVYKVNVWDAKTFEPLGELKDGKSLIYSATFSPDSMHIITALWDGTIKLWDAETFSCLHTIPNIPGLILVGVDLTKLDPRVKFTDKEKELLRTYGAKI